MIGVGVQIRLELEDEELIVVLPIISCLVAGKLDRGLTSWLWSQVDSLMLVGRLGQCSDR